MGVTVLDAGVVIAILDENDAHHAASVRAVDEASRRGDIVILPASAYSEVLVSPSRAGPDAIGVVDSVVDGLPMVVEPIDRAIAGAAAGLRATHGRRLKLGDALVIATAVVLEAERVITTDAGWPETPVRIEVIAEAA